MLLAQFEEQLASPSYAETSAFRVALLGDSTHFTFLSRDERMPRAVEHALAERTDDDFSLVAISAGAFSSYDYYLLLCRLVEDPPDLLVVPVNLRSFGSHWQAIREHDFPRMEAYLPLAELLRGHGLEYGTRFLRWDRLLRVRLDVALFDGNVHAFFRGTQRWVQRERERILRGGTPVARAERPYIWPAEVTSESAPLEAFRRLNDLAARHDVPVLYYTLQANERAQAAKGVDLQLQRHYAFIRGEIGEDPGVTYLDLSDHNPPWMFGDDHEHLTPPGARAVAERLADAIIAHRDGATPLTSAPDPGVMRPHRGGRK